MFTEDNPIIGKRIELISTNDPYTKLSVGEFGTIRFVDDYGTIFVDWDNGSKLGMIPGVDKYRIIHD
jgi:hypothetical protein